MLLSSCTNQSDYNDYLTQYNILYKNAINQIDTEKPSQSIEDHKINDTITQLDTIIDQIDKVSPNKNSNKELLLRQRHEELKEIVNKSLNWEKLSEFEKLDLKMTLSILKNNIDRVGE